MAGLEAPSWGFHLGLLLAGWGIFHVVEGLVDHELLGIHHSVTTSGRRSPGTSASSCSALCWSWQAGCGTSGDCVRCGCVPSSVPPCATRW